MAKPVIKFNAVAYGINGHTGYRPQLESQGGVYDKDLCEEVVKEKRLSMSADELLHAIEMLGEVAAAKVAEDGRPRGVTKLIKWNRYAKGNLESPTSPWNDTCRAYIRAQLLADAVKTIDASFANASDGIGVKLNFVTYVGAQGVQNVVKGDANFGAYGNHMEFDAASGDQAWFEYRGASGATARIDLACVASDVAMAEFEAPSALAALEAGTPMTFWMKSRGGVDGGEVYTSKKQVTYLGGGTPAPQPLSVTKVTSGKGESIVWVGHELTIEGTGLEGATVSATNSMGEDVGTLTMSYAAGKLTGIANVSVMGTDMGSIKVTNNGQEETVSVGYEA